MTTLRDKIRGNFKCTAFLGGAISVALELGLLFGFPQLFSARHSLLPALCVIPTVLILWAFTRCPECGSRFGISINRIIGKRSHSEGPLNSCPHCGVNFDEPVEGHSNGCAGGDCASSLASSST
jgi:DNA-directed RNA polymerase subunit RPC12/RpoP